LRFGADGPVTLDVYARGTAPIARVDIIKDFVYVYSSEPGADEVRFSWTDEESRPPGVSWYYVRILQEDGEIAWGSLPNGYENYQDDKSERRDGHSEHQ